MARARGQKKIDYTRWDRFFFSSSLSAGTLGAVLLTDPANNETLLRTRGNLIAFLDAPSAPNIGIEVGIGFHWVPEGTGTTVITSPTTDADANWWWHESFHLFYEEKVVDVIDVPWASAFRSVIDSKAMRRVPPKMEAQVVVENSTVASAGTLRFGLAGRCLFGV